MIRLLPALASVALVIPTVAPAQWAPVEGDDADDTELPALDERWGNGIEIEPVDSSGGASRMRLVVGALGGGRGLARAGRRGMQLSAAAGIWAGLAPLEWLPIELRVLVSARRGGTTVVSSSTQYLASSLTAGVQYRRGSVRYAAQVGLSATVHHVRHESVDVRVDVADAIGFRVGPAWTLAMRWDLGGVVLRADLSGEWRGVQPDYMLLVGVGWALFPGGVE